MNDSDLELSVRRAVAETAAIHVSQVQKSQVLRDHLGLDSIDLMELIFLLERQFQIKLKRSDFIEVLGKNPGQATVSEVTELVRGKLG
ncbi:MAG: hypothetical protein A2X94_13780 [Bdellovibrionales bacterium GWB1_55_8]|nr:MAG: hypothetical protein A2X94_13780 [Bdellovibrionales bacterium GWB1_55_8]